MAWLELIQPDFAGGMNRRDEKRRLADNQAQVIENFFVDNNGVLFLPKQDSWFNTANDGNRIVGMCRHYCETADQRRLIFVAGNAIKTVDDNQGYLGTLLSGWQTETKQVRFLSDRNYTFIFDGLATVKAYNNYSNGIVDVAPNAPSAGTIAVAATHGAMKGYFRYKTTTITQYGESNASGLFTDGGNDYVYISGVLGGRSVNLSGMTTWATGSSTYTGIYRSYGQSTDTAGLDYYLIAKTQKSTYTDNLPGGAEPTVLYKDNLMPGAPKFGVMWRDRAFWASGSTIYVSDAFIVTSVHLVIEVPGLGDITGMAPLGSMLLIFKPTSIWALTGYDADDFAVSPMIENFGCIAPNTLVEFENYCWFMGKHGVFEMNPSGQIENIGKPIEDVINDFPANRLEDYAIGSFYNRRYYLSLNDGTTARTYVYDLPTKAWTRLNRAYSAFAHLDNPQDTDFTGLLSPLMGALDDSSGWILALQKNSLRLTNARLWGRELDGGDFNKDKLWRSIRLDAEGTGTANISLTSPRTNYHITGLILQTPTMTLLPQWMQGQSLEPDMTFTNDGEELSIRGYLFQVVSRPLR